MARTVAQFTTEAEAQLARNLLELEGIESALQGSALVGMMWHLSNATGGVRLVVEEQDEERACAVLARGGVTSPQASGQGPAIDADGAEEPTNEDFAEPIESEADALASRAYRTAIVGMIFVPVLFHLASLLLLMKVRHSPQVLSSRGRRRVAIALSVDLLVLAVAGLLGWLVLG